VSVRTVPLASAAGSDRQPGHGALHAPPATARSPQRPGLGQPSDWAADDEPLLPRAAHRSATRPTRAPRDAFPLGPRCTRRPSGAAGRAWGLSVPPPRQSPPPSSCLPCGCGWARASPRLVGSFCAAPMCCRTSLGNDPALPPHLLLLRLNWRSRRRWVFPIARSPGFRHLGWAIGLVCVCELGLPPLIPSALFGPRPLRLSWSPCWFGGSPGGGGAASGRPASRSWRPVRPPRASAHGSPWAAPLLAGSCPAPLVAPPHLLPALSRLPPLRGETGVR